MFDFGENSEVCLLAVWLVEVGFMLAMSETRNGFLNDETAAVVSAAIHKLRDSERRSRPVFVHPHKDVDA